MALFIVLFIAVGAASATDINVNDADNGDNLTVSTVDTIANLDNDLEVNNDENLDSVLDNQLSDSDKNEKISNPTPIDTNDSFTALQNLINENKNGTIDLQHNYTYNEETDKNINITLSTGGEVHGLVVANKTLTINGNGFVINGLNSIGGFFIALTTAGGYVYTANLTLNNLTITNCKYDNYGGAIHDNGAGVVTVSNCIFINCSSGMFWSPSTISLGFYSKHINVTGCIFDDNSTGAVVGFESFEPSVYILDGNYWGRNFANVSEFKAAGLIIYNPDNPHFLASWVNLDIVADGDAVVGEKCAFNVSFNGNVADYTVSVNGTEVTIPSGNVGVYNYTPATAGEFTLNVTSVYSGKELLSKTFTATQSINNSFTALQKLIDNATSEGGSGVIDLNDDYCYVSGQDDKFVNGINITKNLIINGNNHVIDGLNLARAFYVDNATLSINNLTIKCTKISNFSSSYTSSYGGAIYVNSGSVNVIYSTFTNCTVTSSSSDSHSYSFGGAICVSGGSVNVTDSTFTNCAATSSSNTGDGYSYGGAIYTNEGNVTVTDSNFTNCAATANATDGYSYGGAIYAFGSVNVTDSTFTNCVVTSNATDSSDSSYSESFGGAIYAYYSVNVTDSTFTNCVATSSSGSGSSESESESFGGAIYTNDGNVTVTDSTFTNCAVTSSSSSGSGSWYTYSYSYGGAIYNSGINCSIRDCSFVNCNAISSSSSSSSSDERQSESFGGAIYSYYSVNVIYSTFTNCTVTSSSSSSSGESESFGGAIYAFGSVNVTDSTFTNCAATSSSSSDSSGGAIYNNGANFTVSGSIFDNCISSNGVIYTYEYAVCDLDGNYWGRNFANVSEFKAAGLIKNSTDNLSASWVNLDIVADGTIIVDKKCDFNLSFNGDVADYIVSVNGTEVVIPSGNVGVYNYTPTVAGEFTLNVTSVSGNELLSKTFTAVAGDPFKNLQELINNNTNGTIDLECNYVFSDSDTSSILINRTLVINGNGFTIDGSNLSRLFNVTSSGNLTLINLNLINGNATSRGGAIYSEGNLNITDCTFTGNNAYSFGGAIYSNGSSANIANCDFVDNTAGSCGGAIFLNNNASNITNCTFDGNSVKGRNNSHHGGAVYVSSSVTEITDCTFTDNFANANGGALYVDSSNVTCAPVISDCTFTNNSAGKVGGAILFYHGSPVVSDCNFTGNNATLYGGAILSYESSVEFKDSAFNNNSAYNGGAIFIGTFDDDYNITNGSYVLSKVNNCDFTDNYVERGGSGIWFNYDLIVEGSNFINNTGSGAIFTDAGYGNLSVSSSNFSENKGTYGAGIYVDSGIDLVVSNCNFTRNNATNGAGIRAGYLTNVKISNSSFFENNATYGAGIRVFDTNVNLTETKFMGNTATYGAAISTNYKDVEEYSGIDYNMSISNSRFMGNTATYGGAISSDVNLNIEDTKFMGNTATYGAVIYDNVGNSTIVINGSKFTSNVADCASCIYTSSNITVNYCIFDNNSNTNSTVYIDCDFYDLNSNYWSTNFANATEFKNSYLIKGSNLIKNSNSVDESISPDNWVYLNIIGKNMVMVNNTYDYNVTFDKLCNANGDLVDFTGSLINYRIIVNNVSANIVDNEYIYTFNATDLGPHNITVKSNYSSEELANFNVLVVDSIDVPVFVIDVVPTTYDDDVSYTVTAKGINNETLNGHITIVVDGGSPVYEGINNGTYSGVISGLSGGEHIINITFTPCDPAYYNPIVNWTVFNVSKAVATVNITVEDIVYGKYANITTIVTGSDGADLGNATTIVVKDSNNHTVDVSDILNVGNYTVYASYDGSINYTNATVNKTFVVNPANVTEFAFNIESITYGDNIFAEVTTVMGVIPESLSGNVTIKIGNKEYNITVVNGIGNITITDLIAASEYTVNVTFVEENGNYNNYINTTSLTIAQFTPTVNLNVSNVVYGTTPTVVCNVTGINGTVISTEYTVVDSDNETVELSNTLPVGTYTVICDYAGNENYTSAKDNMSFVVNPAAFTVFEIFVDNATYTDTVVLKVINATGVNDEAINGIANFTINGVSYLCEVINGIGSYNVTGLNADKYDVYAVLSAYNYNDTDDETSFVVNKMNTTIDAEDLIVTAYAGKDLVITLKDANGNAIAGKLITFTFNDKNYTRITDEDGEATLTIKTSYVGPYPTTITFADEDNYNGATKEVLVTVNPAYVTISQVMKASVTLKKYIANKGVVPSTVTINGVKYTIAQYTYLASAAVKYLNAKKSVSTKIKVITVKASKVNYKVYVNAKKKQYLTVVNKIYSKGTSGTLPTYVTIGSKKIGFNAYTYALSRALAFYNTNKRLPNYLIFTSGF